MKTFIFLCFLVRSFNCEVNLNDINCVESYLKPSFETSEGNCDEVVTNLISELIEKVKTKVTEDKCVLEVFSKYDIAKLYLRGFLAHAKNHTENYDNDVEESIDALSSAAIVICIPNEAHIKDFDKLLNETKSPEIILHDKCFKQYFIYENLIDIEDFNRDCSGFFQNY